MNNMKNEILPYLQIKKMNELLSEIPIKLILEEEVISGNILAKNIGTSKSVASNLITNLKSLQFIEGKGKLTLTKNGRIYIKSIIRDDLKTAKQILTEQIKDLNYFQLIGQKLSQKRKLTTTEIGNQIAIYYDKKWENPATIRTYGSAISSIFDFLEMGYYRNGVLTAFKLEENDGTIPSPEVNVKKIISILEKLFPDGTDIDTLSERLEGGKRRLFSELSCCISLGLTERTFRGFYKLTSKGEEFIHPNITEDTRKTKFREILLTSPYKKIINTIPQDEFDVNNVGDILNFELRKQWSDETKKIFAKKMLNWLNYAEIIEKIERGKYKIKNEMLKKVGENEYKIKKIENQELKSKKKNLKGDITYKDILRYYLLGKNVGSIIAQTDKIEDNDSIINQIIAIHREDKNLNEHLERWKEDYTLFKDYKDPRIFLRDINDLEKLLGVKK